jgi:hypothetical protein
VGDGEWGLTRRRRATVPSHCLIRFLRAGSGFGRQWMA